ncbi:MAG: uncharacterized protein KVP18_004593 [Porospora cf. gigantea A]|uniref:uncharacterized protein n=2 Tax=Porospora cf. gigantea A TaxID=2853593 RepID=UPI003559FAE7|nr:MAG: hypothetical protein KVP18_004593 [Porospora cf. gigantea A]
MAATLLTEIDPLDPQFSGLVQEEDVNNKEELERMLSLIQLKPFGSLSRVPWIEFLSVTCPERVGTEVAWLDKFQREGFYKQMGHRSAVIGLSRLDQLSVPWVKPADFHAEMLKTEKHMEKVDLLEKKDELKRKQAAKRRNDKKAKKVQKQASHERRMKRDSVKKANLAAIAKWKTAREKQAAQGHAQK